MSIKKNVCIEEINNKNIHPLMNIIIDDTEKNKCLVIPQIENNICNIIKTKIDLKEDYLNIDYFNEKKTEKKIEKIEDNVLFFTLPINSNNFLEIVFNISNLEQLNNWLNILNTNNINLNIINTVFNLYWNNNYDDILNDLDLFITINYKLINKFLNKNINLTITNNIINKLINEPYEKNINYIDKIKKYIMLYI